MKLRPDEITKVLRGQIEHYSGTVEVEEVGSVLQVGNRVLDASIRNRLEKLRRVAQAA
jgi:F0F1-type ATP synthase delta subunit